MTLSAVGACQFVCVQQENTSAHGRSPGQLLTTLMAATKFLNVKGYFLSQATLPKPQQQKEGGLHARLGLSHFGEKPRGIGGFSI